jgi:hypothetical protein
MTTKSPGASRRNKIIGTKIDQTALPGHIRMKSVGHQPASGHSPTAITLGATTDASTNDASTGHVLTCA